MRNLSAPMRDDAHFLRCLSVASIIASSLTFPMTAHAQSFGPVLCSFLDNNMGVLSALASLAVILLGISATIGKISWRQAILVAVGISVMFGFVTIVTMISWYAFAPNPIFVVPNWCPGWDRTF